MAAVRDLILKRCDKIEEHYYDIKPSDGRGGTITIKFVNGIFCSIKVPKETFILNHEHLTEEELERLHFLWHEIEAIRNDKKR